MSTSPALPGLSAWAPLYMICRGGRDGTSWTERPRVAAAGATLAQRIPERSATKGSPPDPRGSNLVGQDGGTMARLARALWPLADCCHPLLSLDANAAVGAH